MTIELSGHWFWRGPHMGGCNSYIVHEGEKLGVRLLLMGRRKEKSIINTNQRITLLCRIPACIHPNHTTDAGTRRGEWDQVKPGTYQDPVIPELKICVHKDRSVYYVINALGPIGPVTKMTIEEARAIARKHRSG